MMIHHELLWSINPSSWVHYVSPVTPLWINDYLIIYNDHEGYPWSHSWSWRFTMIHNCWWDNTYIRIKSNSYSSWWFMTVHEGPWPFIFACCSVVANERDEAWICISESLSHLCSMYYVRVRWGSTVHFRPKATVGWRWAVRAGGPSLTDHCELWSTMTTVTRGAECGMGKVQLWKLVMTHFLESGSGGWVKKWR